MHARSKVFCPVRSIRSMGVAVPLCVVMGIASGTAIGGVNLIHFGSEGENEMVEGAVLAPTIGDVNSAMNAQDFAKAAELCRAILKADPKNHQAVFLLGYNLHVQGELDEAILYHLRATGHSGTAPLAYYNLGCAQALKGNPDQAFKALKKAAELGVTNVAQYTGDSDLNSLKNDTRWKKLIDSLGGDNSQPALSAGGDSSSASASASSATASAGSKSDASESGQDHSEALHFWVGDWDVYSAKTGELAGRNSLSFRVGKHVIHERWASEGDSYTGESWNHFDPYKKAWRQMWIGSGGDISEFYQKTDSNVDGVMFIGKGYNPENGEYTMSKMHVREINNGWVRQTGSRSTDDGSTWVIRYDLVYVPKGKKFDLEMMGI
ncbi:MAG: tetratricopeptide repeat protein [Phycisphaerales bacterium]|nr:tetratricopeptide repeat protein [Phycisphaerales bacterium]